jgi:hypothetical protein
LKARWQALAGKPYHRLLFLLESTVASARSPPMTGCCFFDRENVYKFLVVPHRLADVLFHQRLL